MRLRSTVRNLRRRTGPTEGVLIVAVSVFLLGGVLAAAGVYALPNDCETDYGVSLNRTAETDRPVAEAGNLSAAVQKPVRTAVEENRTVFVSGREYDEELANRTVQYEGTLYEVNGTPVRDCAGGIDDFVTLAGFWVAVFGAIATLLVGLFRYGRHFFPTDEEYRRER